MEPDPADVAALLARLEAGELGDPLPVLAYVAGQQVELPESRAGAGAAACAARARRRAAIRIASSTSTRRP